MNKLLPREPAQDIDALLGLKPSSTPGLRGALARRWKAWLIVAVLAVAAAVSAYALFGRSSNTVHYVTEPVTRSDLHVTVTATGSIQPTSQVEVSSELSGTIRRVFVDYNSMVKAGQVVAELDTDKFMANLDSSRAKLNAARASVATAEVTVAEMTRQYARKRTLAATQYVSPQDLETTKAIYDRAVAGLASAKADVGVAAADVTLNESNLNKTRIFSPIDGIVLKRNVDPGQTVAASFQAPVLFTIAEDLQRMELQVDVDEADVGKVQEGQTASFRVDAYPDRTLPGSDPRNPLRFGDGAGRRHLQGGADGRKRRDAAAAGHDGDGGDRRAGRDGRAAGVQRRPSLLAARTTRGAERRTAEAADARHAAVPPGEPDGRRAVPRAPYGCCATVCPWRFRSRSGRATASGPRSCKVRSGRAVR